MSTPDRLGRYAVRRRIGAGSFATVWLAYDEHLDSPVAVKVLAENWAADHHARSRFEAEGRFLRKVESPYVVPVWDAGELPDGRPYLVMAYADQGNLAELLARGPMQVERAVAIVDQIGHGLDALHQWGVLHRDVKPANVLFRTVEGEVRAMVGDLGLGKAVEASSQLTMIGGTPSFVSPEQARGERLDGRTDLYSLGALSYLLLTGRPAHEHASLVAAAHPGPPAPMDLGLADVEPVVARALAVDREDRWPDVPAYLTALRQALGDHPAATTDGLGDWVPIDRDATHVTAAPRPLTGSLEEPPPPVRRRRRGRLLVAAGTAVALLVGGAGGFTWWHRSAPTVSLVDATGDLSVEVPADWDRARSAEEWLPPGAAASYPALSVGTAAGWRAAGADEEGVFVGLMPGWSLPDRPSGVAGCDRPGAADVEYGDAPRMTALSQECPGVVLEQVTRIGPNRLLLVQVRADDADTAREVLGSVRSS